MISAVPSRPPVNSTTCARQTASAWWMRRGPVWAFDPANDILTRVFASGNPLAGKNPDSLTVSPRAGVLLCEDGGGVEDAFGFGERLLGLTPAGETFVLAKSNIMLEPDDTRRAGKPSEFIESWDFREQEWAGATFDPGGGGILLVNIQHPGITFANAGPWRDGTLQPGACRLDVLSSAAADVLATQT